MPETSQSHLELAAEIVGAYVGNNPVPMTELPRLISEVSAALIRLEQPAAVVETDAAPKPAVNPKRSVFPDYIISLENGKQFKSLKRHLMTAYGMTPEQYRAKWGLPRDYPMVAPNYASTRSELAKKLGLGRKPAKAAEPPPEPAPAPRRRRKKAELLS